ncbi:hypothetical protein LARI1_G009204 [Lachnellula arida]|uniref:Uncharacterized protein n=1 Tax=Lachnellula arida TaxID=1316785 RepID=A0A8T9AZL6_9HELO|nr:hypothetical protein LARI1_G009204 [Lachnellula arida]
MLTSGGGESGARNELLRRSSSNLEPSVFIDDLSMAVNAKPDAEAELQSEREAYVAHFVKLKQPKRLVQNRINKHVSRWKAFFYLETTADYHILACEIQDMREGRPKRRKGRLRRPNDQPKRRVSKRLADKRRKPKDLGTSEEDSLSDSAVVFDFDQVDSIPLSEEVNISTEATTSHSSITSSGDPFMYSISNDIDRTPDSISSSFSDLYNSQTLSQYPNLPSLDGRTWYYSDDMNDPASNLGMLHSEMDLAGDVWTGSLQHNIFDGNPMDLKGQSDLASFSASHVLSGNGDNWSGTNVFELESNRSVATTNGLAIAPQEDLDLRNARPSMSSNVDGCTQTQSSEVLLPREKVKNGTQKPRKFDQMQLYIMIAELESQLLERRKHTIPKGPVPTIRPPLEQQDLAPMIEQCLSSLGGPSPYMPKDKKNGIGPQDRRTVQKCGIEVGLQMTVEHLLSAVRVESCHVPTCVS